MAKKQGTLGILIGVILLLLLPTEAISQVQDPWQGPLRLSAEGAEASEAFMVADNYGYLHVFWHEVNGDDGRITIQYRRYDGQVWSRPVDIYVAPVGRTIGYLAPAVDGEGNLYLLWTDGNSGPVYLASAPAHSALSAQTWTNPHFLDIPAYRLRMQIDREGVFHILYSEFYSSQPGVYHTRSPDGGRTWSAPHRLDPDIPVNQAPNVLQLTVDDQGGLHALWYDVDLEEAGALGTWVRYAHALDGANWSTPFTVDVADEETDELRLPHPELAVTGTDVHVVWAGDNQTHREHRVSSDRGKSWSVSRRILGDLQGQGLGGQLVVDSLGRTHYLAQIRWPMAIWHTVWESSGWKAPIPAYIIARTDDESRNLTNNRIHAHNIRAILMGGNQLVVTFTNSPTDPEPLALYAMHRTLPELPALAPSPTPTRSVSATSLPVLVAKVPTATPAPAPPMTEPAQTSTDTAQSGVFLGVVPGLLLVAAVITLRVWGKLYGR